MDPAATPHLLDSSFIWGTSFSPFGKSQSTCRAIVGHAPVNWLTMPASLNFSAILVAAAGCTNLPKRVPVLANPQECNSILNRSSACQTEPSASCATVSPIRMQQANSLSSNYACHSAENAETYCSVSVSATDRVCVPDPPDKVTVEVAGGGA